MDKNFRNDKVLILGMDGMDPAYSQMLLELGEMPNLKQLIDRGAANKELRMIGGHPTVTPPMWTTLATGASPFVHGIIDYNRLGSDIDTTTYNFDSRNCRAEQMWNVTAEAGYKTLVWHWPGSSWPPSSDNENLYVIDGTQPEGVNCGNAQIESEFFVMASADISAEGFRSKDAQGGAIPCMLTDMETEESDEGVNLLLASERRTVTVWETCGKLIETVSNPSQDVVYSPLKDAAGWKFSIPEASKEFAILFSKGLVRRPCLLVKESGKYSKVIIYKSKKDETPIAEIVEGKFTENIIDEVIVNEKKITANRHIRIIDVDEAGEKLQLYVSPAMDIGNNDLWSPKSLFDTVTANVGYPQPIGTVSGTEDMFKKCTYEMWELAAKWTAQSIKYLIKAEDFKVVFSHFHSIDLQGHMTVNFMKNGTEFGDAESYRRRFLATYQQADRYIGEYLPLLDEGWTIMLVSDHGQICPEYETHFEFSGDGCVVAANLLDWGYTVLKEENGKPVVDLSKSTAVQVMTGHIFINLKGRDPNGIVEPEDKYNLEEEIITKLHGLTSEKTGYRMIHMALRNRDAILLGEGGPGAGDIIFHVAEGYNYDHADTLSTALGFNNTSVASIFVAAGPGIKQGILTERIVHHNDVVPTMAMILGTRMPYECEGAPIYQILD